jgi:hypothetical protein
LRGIGRYVSLTREQASTHKHLKTITNPQYEATFVNKLLQLLTKVHYQVFCQQCSSAKIIAIRKSTWNDKQMVVKQALRGLEQLIDM